MRAKEILAELSYLDRLKSGVQQARLNVVGNRAQREMGVQVKNLADKIYASWAGQIPNFPDTVNASQLAQMIEKHADNYLADGPVKPGTSQVKADNLQGVKDIKGAYNYFINRSREHFTPRRAEPTIPPAAQPAAASPAVSAAAASTPAASNQSTDYTDQDDNFDIGDDDQDDNFDIVDIGDEPTTISPGAIIQMPGTNMNFTYTPQWLDASGKPANSAVSKVLSQIASGTKLDQLDMGDLRAARRSIGLVGSKLPKKPRLRD